MSGRPLMVICAAVAVFLLALDGGNYSVESRGVAGVFVWWFVALAIGLRLLPSVRITRGIVVAGAFLAALTAWTGLSMIWAADTGTAFAELARTAEYLGVFVLVASFANRANVGRLLDGVAVGLTGVACISLASRFFPSLFPGRNVSTFLAGAATRLSYPVDYWNGLAILLALGVPVLLRSALSHRRRAMRGLALAPLPAFASVIFLTSSRGGTLTAVVAVLIFLLIAADRWAALGAIAIAGVGSIVAIDVLVRRPDFVNHPDLPDALGQGHTAAGLVALACIATGIVYAFAVRRVRAPRSGRVGWAVLSAAVLVVAAGVVASHPVSRFHAFTRPLPSSYGANPVQGHLLSVNSTGRWQQWASAIAEFKHSPLHGEGAGSYEAWWAQHGTIDYFVLDAHSLYAETMGELGIVGLLLLVGLIGSGISVAVQRFRSAGREERLTLAAVTAGFVAYGVSAALDWVWELPVIDVVAFGYLAILLSAATTGPAPLPEEPRLYAVPEARRASWRPGRRFVRVVGVVVACAAIAVEAVPLLAAVDLGRSQQAVGSGNTDQALSSALSARALEPWSSEPYLQLALVTEQEHEYASARSWIVAALRHDHNDWRLWLVRARIETKLGRTEAATSALARAVQLNPRSPFFAGLRLSTVP